MKIRFFAYNTGINPLFWGFGRRNYNQVDMWQRLEQNWKNFFWLTGEIPASLNLIVEAVNSKMNCTIFGCKEKLSLRNQVCIQQLMSKEMVLTCLSVITYFHSKVIKQYTALSFFKSFVHH